MLEFKGMKKSFLASIIWFGLGIVYKCTMYRLYKLYLLISSIIVRITLHLGCASEGMEMAITNIQDKWKLYDYAIICRYFLTIMNFHISFSDFLVADLRRNHGRTIMMATQEQLQLLARAKTWYIDGKNYTNIQVNMPLASVDKELFKASSWFSIPTINKCNYMYVCIDWFQHWACHVSELMCIPLLARIFC